MTIIMGVALLQTIAGVPKGHIEVDVQLAVCVLHFEWLWSSDVIQTAS